MKPQQAVDRFYELLDRLREHLGGPRRLESATHGDGWPERGVYFFFEPGEPRDNSEDRRVVRVGTHGLRRGSSSTLWGRLRQHRGTIKGKTPGGGNHRGSIFRLHVGTALLERDDGYGSAGETWGSRGTARPGIRAREVELERAVSRHIRSMPFLWLGVDDEPGADSLRGVIERNAIGLLSNAGVTEPVDPPSSGWLGRHARSPAIRRSGLWNVNHVEDDWDEGFLDVLEGHIKAM